MGNEIQPHNQRPTGIKAGLTRILFETTLTVGLRHAVEWKGRGQ